MTATTTEVITMSRITDILAAIKNATKYEKETDKEIPKAEGVNNE